MKGIAPLAKQTIFTDVVTAKRQNIEQFQLGLTASGNEANEDWVIHDGAIVTPLINPQIDTSDENEKCA